MAIHIRIRIITATRWYWTRVVPIISISASWRAIVIHWRTATAWRRPTVSIPIVVIPHRWWAPTIFIPARAIIASSAAIVVIVAVGTRRISATWRWRGPRSVTVAGTFLLRLSKRLSVNSNSMFNKLTSAMQRTDCPLKSRLSNFSVALRRSTDVSYSTNLRLC